jgi:hypothetical protein
MTLKYMQGFETCRDDSDLRVQGWSGVSPIRTGYVPAAGTGVSGTSLHTIGPGNAPGGLPGSSGAPDPGVFNTGVTVNQAWTAGGFTFGSFAKINSGVATSYGSGNNVYSMQACFDGTRYWAIQLIGSTYNLATSPDLINWTVTPVQPTALDSYATVSYMGGGVVAVIRSTTSTAAQNVYYTSNIGASWSTQTIFTNGSSSNVTGVGIATGNSTYPHAVIITTSITGNAVTVAVGTLGGTMTVVGNLTSGTSAVMCFRPRIVGGLIVFGTSAGQIFTATASSSTLNTSAAWSTATTAILPIDIAYNPTSNLWVIATSSGIYTTPNSGAVGTPVALTGSITPTQRYSTIAMLGIAYAGAQNVALGLSGHIVTSPDGITWTESAGHILPVGTSGYDWRCMINDGSRYVLFTDSNTGVIATTPDLATNYASQYIQDAGRGSPSNNAGIYGIYSGTAPSATTGLWTANATFFALNVGTPSAGVCSMVVSTGSTTNLASFNVSVATTYGHYYEMVFSPTATVNTFNVTVYVDGVLTATYTSLALVGTGDTTSLLMIVLSRRNDFVAYDDMYFTVNDGVGQSGQLGQINIIARRPTTDVQAQWVKNGSAASNSLSVNNPALSSQTKNYLSSGNAGDKDVYTSSDVIPVGYTPKAVQLEAVFTRGSSTAPSVNIGLISSGTESDSSTVSVGSSATYISKIYQNDPNGNAAWTSANITAAQMTASHIV